MMNYLACFLLALQFSYAQSDRDFFRLEEANFALNESMIQEMDLTNASYYSVTLMDKEALMAPEVSDLIDLDYLKLHRLEGAKYLVSKHAYMIGRSADFFSCQTLGNLRYVRTLENESAVRKAEMSYQIESKRMKVAKFKYDLNWFAQLPDCQLENEAFPKLNELDPEVKFQLHGVILKEKINFTKVSGGSWAFSKIYRVPNLKGEKTLVITYEIDAMLSQVSIKNLVESAQIHAMSTEEIINSRFEEKMASGKMD